MTLIEPNLYGGWISKQAAQGTAGAAGTARRQSWVSDDFGINVDDGNLQVSDLTQFGTNYRYRNTVQAAGSPQFAALPSETAFNLWLAHGSETVTGPTNELQTITVTGTPTGGTFTLVYTYRDSDDRGYRHRHVGDDRVQRDGGERHDGSVDDHAAVREHHDGWWAAARHPDHRHVHTALAGQPVRALTLGTNSLTGGSTPTAAVTRTTPG
jgi:hypothetical protein